MVCVVDTSCYKYLNSSMLLVTNESCGILLQDKTLLQEHNIIYCMIELPELLVVCYSHCWF